MRDKTLTERVLGLAKGVRNVFLVGTLVAGAYLANLHLNVRPKNNAPFQRQLCKKENISKLEGIIRQENMVYDRVKYRPVPWNKLDREQVWNDYENKVEPVIQRELAIPVNLPRSNVHIGREETFNVPLKFLLFYGLLVIGSFCVARGVYGLYLLKKRQKPIRTTLCTLFYAGAAYTAFTVATVFAYSTDPITNFYDPLFNHIGVSQDIGITKTNNDMSVILGHEAVHYFQDKANVPDSPIGNEGHARVVELRVAKELFSLTGNPGYLKPALERELIELTSIYYLLCVRNGVKPNPRLFRNTPETLDRGTHAQGTTIFKLLERKYGSLALRAYIHSPEQFQKMLKRL